MLKSLESVRSFAGSKRYSAFEVQRVQLVGAVLAERGDAALGREAVASKVASDRTLLELYSRVPRKLCAAMRGAFTPSASCQTITPVPSSREAATIGPG